jgi:hypothetical protein
MEDVSLLACSYSDPDLVVPFIAYRSYKRQKSFGMLSANDHSMKFIAFDHVRFVLSSQRLQYIHNEQEQRPHDPDECWYTLLCSPNDPAIIINNSY